MSNHHIKASDPYWQSVKLQPTC